jgi:hypothetical protein
MQEPAGRAIQTNCNVTIIDKSTNMIVGEQEFDGPNDAPQTLDYNGIGMVADQMLTSLSIFLVYRGSNMWYVFKRGFYPKWVDLQSEEPQ